MSASSLVDANSLPPTSYRAEIKCHRSIDTHCRQAVLYCCFKSFDSSWPFHVLMKISQQVVLISETFLLCLTLMKEYFQITAIWETEMRLPSDCPGCNTLQPSFMWQKPALKHPGKPQRAFQEEAGRFGGCPTLCAGMAAELKLPQLTTAQLSYGAMPPHCRCLWPAMYSIGPDPVWLPSDTGTASSLWSHLVTSALWLTQLLPLGLPWAGVTDLCSGLHLSPASSPGTCLTSSLNLEWIPFFPEPCSCLQTAPCSDSEGWGPGWWVAHAARLVSMLCPDSPALKASHPSLGLTVTLELGVQTGYPQNKGLALC